MHLIVATQKDPAIEDYTIFFAGFMASSIVWAFVCAAIVDRVFRRAGARWARVTYRVCAAAFLALALGSVRDLVSQATTRSEHAKPAAIAPES